MIKVGQQKKAKYWGNFTVNKVARLTTPVRCKCKEIGEAFFDPTIVKISWEQSPSEDKHEFWFPYLDYNRRERKIRPIRTDDR